jgi:hypothetical protein
VNYALAILFKVENKSRNKSIENVVLTTKGPTVNCPSQETEETSTPTRPVENVV